jgi:hypothetical protein
MAATSIEGVQRMVMMDARAFDNLPCALGQQLAHMAHHPTAGFTIIDNETGEPINTRLTDWLVGTIAMAWGEIIKPGWVPPALPPGEARNWIRSELNKTDTMEDNP